MHGGASPSELHTRWWHLACGYCPVRILDEFMGTVSDFSFYDFFVLFSIICVYSFSLYIRFYISKFPSGCVGKSKSSQKELSLRSFWDCPEFNANKVFIGGLYHVTFCLLLGALPNILWPSFRCGFMCVRSVVWVVCLCLALFRCV